MEKEDAEMVRLTMSFAVTEQQLESFKSIARAMTEASKAEPGTLGYEWFAASDGKRFRLVERYVDSRAVEAHMTGPAVQEWVPKLVAVCTVEGLEIYGDPGPKVAEMVSGFGAAIYYYWTGIDR